MREPLRCRLGFFPFACLLTLWMLLSSWATAAAAAPKPFRIATFPYVQEVSWKDLPHTLFFEALMAQHGYTVEMVFLPGKRALRNLELGLVDGELGRVKGTSKVSRHLFESASPFSSICLRKVYRRGNVVGLPKLIGHQAGAQGVESMIKRLWPQARGVSYLTFRQAARLLASRRLDLILLPHIGESHIQSMGLTEFDIQPFLELPLHFMVGDEHRDLLPALEATAKTLKLQYPGLRCR